MSLFIATDSGLLTITGETTELHFEGGNDTYARFRIDDGATDLDAASKSGDLYYFNSGQTVDEPIHGWEDRLDVEYAFERQTFPIDSLRRTGPPDNIG